LEASIAVGLFDVGDVRNLDVMNSDISLNYKNTFILREVCELTVYRLEHEGGMRIENTVGNIVNRQFANAE